MAHDSNVSHLPISDFKNWFPPILIAHIITVMIPIGAVPRRILSAHPIDVDKNCLVISSPKRVRRGAKSVKALFSKFEASAIAAVALAIAAAVLLVGLVGLAIVTNVPRSFRGSRCRCKTKVQRHYDKTRKAL